MEKYILALLKCKGIGNVKLLNYINKYKKNIKNILKNLSEFLSREDLTLFDQYVELAEQEILYNKQKGIDIICVLNDNYPIKLIEIKDPVLYLYYKGNIDLLNNTSIAIIGSREINDDEKRLTNNIAKKISSKGITVVSGLALGTDTYAHLGSYKETGKTISILPSGIDIITPSSNKKLTDQILKNQGLLISEYSIGTYSTKYSYVKRDRIQAAISDAIIVIKASETSGTMHAVKIAQKSNKYVSQYKDNNNKIIKNVFENNDEDIDSIISFAEKRKYKRESMVLYEQERLF